MTLEGILSEFGKGCSCSAKNPADCKECLDAAVRAVKYWFGKEGGWSLDAAMEEVE